MEDFGHWTCNYPKVPEEALGFIYKITFKQDGRIYFGKKQLTKRVKKKPLKGKKKARITNPESDWKTYTSSSREICELIEKHGKEAFDFEIIRFCSCKWELAYWEAKIQFDNEVLFYPERFFNGIINLRIGRRPKDLPVL